MPACLSGAGRGEGEGRGHQVVCHDYLPVRGSQGGGKGGQMYVVSHGCGWLARAVDRCVVGAVDKYLVNRGCLPGWSELMAGRVCRALLPPPRPEPRVLRVCACASAPSRPTSSRSTHAYAPSHARSASACPSLLLTKHAQQKPTCPPTRAPKHMPPPPPCRNTCLIGLMTYYREATVHTQVRGRGRVGGGQGGPQALVRAEQGGSGREGEEGMAVAGRGRSAYGIVYLCTYLCTPALVAPSRSLATN